MSQHTGSIPVFELPALPPSEQPLDPWYHANVRRFEALLGLLAERRAAEVRYLAGMTERGRKALWWPFTQHDSVSEGDVTLLDSAYGDYFCAAEVEEAKEDGGEVRETV